jgi:hypothetical protein
VSVEIGTAIVSYIEPACGHARDFNTWYERDHFPATVLAGPGVFAGARFVATRACKQLRPPGAGLLGDPARGSYLAIAWVLPGRQREWDAWVAREMETIAAEGRLFPHREHVHTAVYRFVRATGRVPAVSALAHGFAGVVAAARVPQVGGPLPAGDCTVVLAAERTIVSSADPPPHELALAFTALDPCVAFRKWSPGTVGFASPFLATVPGTDTYTDDL